MIDSTFKKSKHRRNSFDSEFNAQEDFLLADLQAIPDDTDLTIAPLEHLLDEEDAIDRLLVNTGFDTATDSMQGGEKFDGFAADALSLITEVAGFEELSGQQENDQAFFVEPVVESTRQTDVAAIPDTNFQIDEFISDYFDKRSHGEVSVPQITLDSDIPIQALETDDLIESRLKVEPLVEELEGAESSVNNSVAPTIDIPSKEPEAITKPDAGFQIDDFISNYFDKRPNIEIIHPEPSSEPKADDLFDITTRARTDTAPAEKSRPVEQEVDSSKTIAETITGRFSGGAAVLNAGRELLNKLKPDQNESVIDTTENKAAFVSPHLLTEGEKTHSTVYNRLNKTEQTSLITYAALAVGVAALLSITVLGILVYDMKNEVSKLSVLLEIIKDDVEAHAVKTSEAK